MAAPKKKPSGAVNIPIEDASDEVVAPEETQETQETDADPSPAEPEVEDEQAPADEACDEDDEFVITEEDLKAAAKGDAAAADDIIAEAEAIVEEASAAEQLEKALADATERKERYMRLHAEWDTYRRRTNEQREQEKVRAAEKLVEDLIPMLDDFERTVDYAEKNGEAGLLEGVRAVQTKLIDALTKHGMETINPAGESFDALEAQAVGTVPDDEAFDETVRDVYQKGYKMGKKVLRPAMVTITTGGPARPKPEENDND